MRKENILRKRLNEGKPTLGTHIVTPWPGMFEVVGNSGVFDYIEYVSEYSTWTLPLLDEIGRTMELFPENGSNDKNRGASQRSGLPPGQLTPASRASSLRTSVLRKMSGTLSVWSGRRHLMPVVYMALTVGGTPAAMVGRREENRRRIGSKR